MWSSSRASVRCYWSQQFCGEWAMLFSCEQNGCKTPPYPARLGRAGQTALRPSGGTGPEVQRCFRKVLLSASPAVLSWGIVPNGSASDPGQHRGGIWTTRLLAVGGGWCCFSQSCSDSVLPFCFYASHLISIYVNSVGRYPAENKVMLICRFV